MEAMHPYLDVPYSELSNVHGPVDWENASHGVEYDHQSFLVLTYAVFGPSKNIRMITKVRLMTESEMIFSKLRGHSRESVLKAFDIQEPQPTPQARKKPWWKFWIKRDYV